MNSGTLKMTGIAGLVWGILAILVLLAGIVFGVRAVQSGAAGAAASTGFVVQIVSLIAALALCWMLFQLSQVLGSGMAAMACYATIAVTIILQVLNFAGVTSGILAAIFLLLQGIGLVMVGVFGIMGKRFTSGSFKAFNVLMIITGACLVLFFLIFTLLIYPFLALATGIVLFVAMNGAAKTATA